MFLPLLLQLFSVCRVANCGSSVDDENISVKPNGAMIRVHCLCNNNHSTEWDSSPKLGSGKSGIPVINVLLSIYCLTTGLHIHQVECILPEYLHLSCLFFRSWISFLIFTYFASEKACTSIYKRRFFRESFGCSGCFLKYCLSKLFVNIYILFPPQKAELDKVKENQAQGSAVNLAGDGKYDSPGRF